MQTQRWEDVVARIDAVRRAQPDGIVAFDGDGTLWSGDVGEDFFHAFVAYGRFEAAACDSMRRDAREFGLDDAGAGAALAMRLYEAYRRGAFPEERICELMAWGCAGWLPEEVRALARRVVIEGGLPERVHAEALEVLRWARLEGVESFVVSASPCDVVEEAAAYLDVDAAHVVAAVPQREGARLLAEVERPIPYGPGKVLRLAQRSNGRPLLAAFGDNLFDIPLLCAAVVPVAVRPKPRLSERAREVAGLIELDRGSRTSP